MNRNIDQLIKKKIKNNQVFKDLSKLGLVNLKNIRLFNHRTRDKRIPVLIDIKTKLIFLSEVNHTSKIIKKKIDQFEGKNFKNNITVEKYKKKKFILVTPNDDLRRYKYMKKYIKNKSVLDFGCGIGTFIKLSNKITKESHGLEINKNLLLKLKNKSKIFSNIDQINNKYDYITMFHVLEHIPNSIEVLKKLKKLLKPKGKLIIEIPHAKDILFNINEFKNFSLWSEHLVLHTEKSVEKILKYSGYKVINTKYIQRYNFINHLGWFLREKPQGHIFFKNFYNEKINKKYVHYLSKNKITDTLFITARV